MDAGRDEDGRVWHALPAAAALAAIRTDAATGLAPDEAARRLREAGPNELPEARPPSWPSRLAGQFTQLLVVLLLAAAAVSILIGDRLDAVAIGAIVVINALLGFVQEYRAERALRSLRGLAAPHARVLRGGSGHEIDAAGVVSGDILLIAAGDTVAADARLVEEAALRMDEALLTGESTPVEKSVEPVAAANLLADRASMVYQGTLAIGGRGVAVVVAAGARTEMGRIAASVSAQRPPPTPLQGRLTRLGQVLTAGALVLSALVLVTSLARGLGFEDGFFTAISLSVAAVPEGLPAATTILLALAVQRMAARRAIVRRLLAVESLGSVTVICVDKTGTLTENRMRVEELWLDGRLHPISSAGEADPDLLRRLLRVAAVCNDATAGGDGNHQGDPTEVALLRLAGELMPSHLAAWWGARRLEETPFDPARRRMSVLAGLDGAPLTLTKGAPETVVPRCVRQATAGGERPLDATAAAAIIAEAETVARRGLRVLALADGDASAMADERGLTLIGLVGMADPLRPEARPAIERALAAGIRVIMITGDHALTARVIAERAGMGAAPGAAHVVTGAELAESTPGDLAALARGADVFARVTSQHKLDIVRALRANGDVVAMTGDGVNDAPALRAAHIGIAMGVGGTDVARDAADLVLADNNFETIIAAVEEGRTVFANLRSVIHFLLTCNLAEVAVVFGLLVAAGATPLIPLQILFVNLLTDSLPALALGVEPPEPQFMRARPRRSSAIFARDSIPALAGIGGLVALATYAAYAWGALTDGEGLASRMTFATLVGSQLAASLAFRSEVRSVFRLPPNLWLLLAVVGSTLAMAAVFYLPTLQDTFDTAPLSAMQWGIVAALSLAPFVVVEAIKLTGLARWLPGDGK
jgi:Ca2+-transporting ATPase